MRRNGTPKERLLESLSVLGVSAFDFEERCGLGHGFVSRVTHVITKKTRAKIKLVFPNLNIDYVTHGIGDILSDNQSTPTNTIKERIGIFKKMYDISDVEFCKRAGLAVSFTKNMSDSVRKSSLERIYRAFPQINPSWLEYGEGNITKEENSKKTKSDVETRIDTLITFLGTTKAAFYAETKFTPITKDGITKRSVDKIVKRYPFVSPSWLMHGNGDMMVGALKPMISNLSYAPLVNQCAYAGYLMGFADDDYVNKLEKIPYVTTKETYGNIMAFEVSGDSMDDDTSGAYKNGDIVICREVGDYDKIELPIRHYDFVIVHKEGILIKQIKKHEVEKGMIVIHSLNSFYEDREIHLKDVTKIFVVVTKISSQRK